MASHSMYEWIYIGVVIALLVWVGADSWNIEHMLEAVPPNAEVIKVIGQQWFWTFQHVDGTREVSQLHVIQGIPYRFEIVSQDVIHSFNIPDFAVLTDAVPGRINTQWSIFDVPGQYLIECREYCGLLHYNMRAQLFVLPPGPKVIDHDSISQVSAAASASAIAASSASATNTTGAAAAATSIVGPKLSILAGASIQGNPAYTPDTLTVKKGDTIQVTNKDTVPHTVTNGKDASDPTSGKVFDTSIINGGATAQVSTAKLSTGDYPFHCSIHPYMTGLLKVQ
ncbi:MAG TPA: cupredoxin domain-containing protein [Candidatus Bathyarchaeia archaeon]|nr:cupredoxin domain-containing protein [Candidatus Bathyarchaeia archaeon]